MKKAVSITLCLFLTFVLSAKLNAQAASYAEGGFMNAPLKKSGDYLPGRMTGFSTGISGLEFTLYAGQFQQRQFPDSVALRMNGGFWNIGYIWRSEPRPNLKRFHYTVGGGIGGYGIGEENGVQLNLHPGVQINLTRSVSIAGSCYIGFNMFDKMRQEGGLLYENNYYKSTKGFFFMPNITLRLNTNPLMVMGEGFQRSTYWGGGVVNSESTSREGDYIVTRKTSTYLPAGEYITDAIITSTNYVNVYPKFLVGSRKNDRGLSVAAGAGAALRVGILALDVEYLGGKIGFRDIVNQTGNNQDYWKMRRTTVGIGINFFNIPFPFRGPSLIRLILGARIGKINLESNRDPILNPPAGTSPNPENLLKHKYVGPFWAIEFGTLGVHMELINNKYSGYGSGALLGITYLIPLGNFD